MLGKLPVWEAMAKRMIWHQLGEIQDQKILDFGSGTGVTADYYARCNEVIAIEPSAEAVHTRWQNHSYMQLVGSTDQLKQLPDASFDVILCHNVLEYVPDRETIIHEFARLLKADGLLSIVKHNRPGRVMQMAVLLNDFKKANELLDGKDGSAQQFGAIRYYEDADIEKWSDQFHVFKTFGIRTFWDLQQKQDVQNQPDWQEQMLALEKRVSELKEYQAIAFFHHLLIRKKGEAPA